MAKAIADPQRQTDVAAFDHLLDQLALATMRCTDEQLVDLADSLHATLLRRREYMGMACSRELRSFDG